MNNRRFFLALGLLAAFMLWSAYSVKSATCYSNRTVQVSATNLVVTVQTNITTSTVTIQDPYECPAEDIGTLGEQTWFVGRIIASDSAPAPTEAQWRAVLDQLNQYVAAVSEGKAWGRYVIAPVVAHSSNSVYAAAHYTELVNFAKAQWIQAGLFPTGSWSQTYPKRFRYIYAVEGGYVGGGGNLNWGGYFTGNNIASLDRYGLQTMVHEFLGHGQSLGHAATLNYTSNGIQYVATLLPTNALNFTLGGYSDQSDPMGSAKTPGYNAVFREMLSWMSIPTVAGGTHRIYALTYTNAPGLRAVRVTFTNSPYGFIVSKRALLGVDNEPNYIGRAATGVQIFVDGFPYRRSAFMPEKSSIAPDNTPRGAGLTNSAWAMFSANETVLDSGMTFSNPYGGTIKCLTNTATYAEILVTP
jgi:hypothetical protein